MHSFATFLAFNLVGTAAAANAVDRPKPIVGAIRWDAYFSQPGEVRHYPFCFLEDENGSW